jgi:hypothetical protein
MEEFTEVKLVCPKCEAQSVFPVSASQSVNQLACPQCQTQFICRLVQIRSKNSRSNKSTSGRAFSVRVKDLRGGEDLIEFTNPGGADFELRSKDLAVFSYHDNRLAVVQNLTVGRYMSIKTAGCLGSMVVVFLTLLTLGFALFSFYVA